MQRVQPKILDSYLGTRRFYQDYSGYYPPPSSWDLYAPRIVTGGAVGLCIAGFAYHHYSINRYTNVGDRSHIDIVEQNFVNSRENLQKGRWWTLITSSFMHFSGLHLGCNMLPLLSFGPGAVRAFGPSGFVGLWLGSAVVCGAAELLWEQVQEQERRKRPNDRIKIFGHQLVKDDPTLSTTFAKSIGASGSLGGIITAICCSNPRMRIYLFPVPFAIPAYGATLAFATFSLYAMVTGLLPWIGHAGHLGGLTWGAVYYYAWLRRRLRFPRF